MQSLNVITNVLTAGIKVTLAFVSTCNISDCKCPQLWTFFVAGAFFRPLPMSCRAERDGSAFLAAVLRVRSMAVTSMPTIGLFRRQRHLGLVNPTRSPFLHHPPFELPVARSSG